MRVLRFVSFVLLLIVPGASRALVHGSGDVVPPNGVDVADLVVVEQLVRGELPASSLTELQRRAADVAPMVAGDVPGDGRFDAADVLLLARAVQGQDVDGDGLDPAGEQASGTSPFDPDTDGDGSPDGADVAPLSDDDGDGFLDGQDPETHRYNTIVGRVEGLVGVGDRCDGPSREPFPDIEVVIRDATGAEIRVFTDARGYFSAAALTPPLQYDVSLSGRYVRVNDTSAEVVTTGEVPNPRVQGSIVPGVPLRVVFGPENSSLYQRMLYFHGHRAHRFYSSVDSIGPQVDGLVEYRIADWHFLYGAAPRWCGTPCGSVPTLLFPSRLVSSLNQPGAKPFLLGGYELPVEWGELLGPIYHEYGHEVAVRLYRGSEDIPANEGNAESYYMLATGKLIDGDDLYPGCVYAPSYPTDPPRGELDDDYPFDPADPPDPGYPYGAVWTSILADVFQELVAAPLSLDPLIARTRLAKLFFDGLWIHGPGDIGHQLDGLFIADEIASDDDFDLTTPSQHAGLLCSVIRRAGHYPTYVCPASRELGAAGETVDDVFGDDSDGDGFTDAREYALRTDSQRPQVMGHVAGDLLRIAEGCGGTVEATGLPNLTIEFLDAQGSVFDTATTDAGGDFVKYGVTAPVSYRARLRGPVVDVGTGDGAATDPSPTPIETLTGTIQPGARLALLFEGGGPFAGAGDYARTAFYHMNRAHDALTAIDPALVGLESSLPVYLRDGIGGATEYKQGPPRIRLGRSLGHSASSPSAILHEYGHAVTDVLYDDDEDVEIDPGDGPAHEGNADVLSVLLTGDSRVGLGLYIGPTQPYSCSSSPFDAANDLTSPPSTDTRLLLSGIVWNALEALHQRYPGADAEVRSMLMQIWHFGRKRSDRVYPVTIDQNVAALFEGDEIAFGDGNPATPSPHEGLLCVSVRAALPGYVCP